jgi:hypothetical protein
MGKLLTMPAPRTTSYRERMEQQERGVMSSNTLGCVKVILIPELQTLYDPSSSSSQKRSARHCAVNILATAFGETCTWRERAEMQFLGGKVTWEPNKRKRKMEI